MTSHSVPLHNTIGSDATAFQITRDDEDMFLLFGRTVFDLISAEHGPNVAREFMDAVTIPTLPRTPERTTQDGAEMVLADLVEAIAP